MLLLYFICSVTSVLAQSFTFPNSIQQCVSLHGKGECVHILDCPVVLSYIRRNQLVEAHNRTFSCRQSGSITENNVKVCCLPGEIKSKNTDNITPVTPTPTPRTPTPTPKTPTPTPKTPTPTPKTPTPTPKTPTPTPITPTPTPTNPNSSSSPLTDVLPAQCGTQKILYRIVGGEDAGFGEFPWIVALFFQSSSRENPLIGCGGTLISRRYVVTAAHCLDSNLLGNYKLSMVRMGEYNLATPVDRHIVDVSAGTILTADPPQEITPETIILHPEYSRSRVRVENDIALIRLSRDVVFTDWVQPICLPINQDALGDADFTGTLLTVAGWGNTDPEIFQSRSDILQKLAVPVVPLSQCKQQFSPNAIADYHICAGGEPNKDSCKGDSGGPLIRILPNGVNFLVGAVSFGGPRCATAGLPGVYVSISDFLPWILSHMHP